MDERDLTRESETLFIPLLGKAEVERYGHILWDPKAREIVSHSPYDFSKWRQSKFLSIYMGIRAAILDRHAEEFIAVHPDAVVLHLGCGLDSRVERVKGKPFLWIDLDLPDVITVRRRYFPATEGYRMVAASVTDHRWLDQVEAEERPVLVIAEGLTMYLTDGENKALVQAFQQRFRETQYIFDAYSASAVRWSKRKNPVNKMGAAIRWGLDDPQELCRTAPGVSHLATEYFTGRQWEEKLSGSTRFWFHVLYGNAWANSLYRIYSYQIKGPLS